MANLGHIYKSMEENKIKVKVKGNTMGNTYEGFLFAEMSTKKQHGSVKGFPYLGNGKWATVQFRFRFEFKRVRCGSATFRVCYTYRQRHRFCERYLWSFKRYV